MVSPRAGRGAVPIRENYSFACVECDRLAARLCPRALLDEQQFTTFEVAPTPAERAGELQRERDLAVQVLMQAVVAALLIAKDQRRRLRLSVRGADFQEIVERSWIRIARAHPLSPSIRRRRQLAIHREAQILDQRRHRAREILILADAVAMAFHHDAAAEAIAIRVERDQLRAFGWAQYRARRRIALRVEIACDSRPVQRRNAIDDGRDSLMLMRRWRGRTLQFFRLPAVLPRASARKPGRRESYFPTARA